MLYIYGNIYHILPSIHPSHVSMYTMHGSLGIYNIYNKWAYFMGFCYALQSRSLRFAYFFVVVGACLEGDISDMSRQRWCTDFPVLLQIVIVRG